MKKIRIEMIVPENVKLDEIPNLIQYGLKKWLFPSSKDINLYSKMQMEIVRDYDIKDDSMTLILTEKQSGTYDEFVNLKKEEN